MPDIIVVLGTEPELLLLASSLDNQFCNKQATVCFHDSIPSPNNYDRIFLVGHANISKIGQFDAQGIVQVVKNFSDTVAQKYVLLGAVQVTKISRSNKTVFLQAYLWHQKYMRRIQKAQYT